MSPDIVELIFQTAPMQDIGKIGIPDNILKKQGILDPGEFEVMQEHVSLGEDVLHPLKGEEIPLEGRIVAIADIFDALSSKRHYKKAYPMDKCLSIINELKGNHLDPKVVEIFNRELKQITSIYQNLKG